MNEDEAVPKGWVYRSNTSSMKLYEQIQSLPDSVIHLNYIYPFSNPKSYNLYRIRDRGELDICIRLEG